MPTSLKIKCHDVTVFSWTVISGTRTATLQQMGILRERPLNAAAVGPFLQCATYTGPGPGSSTSALSKGAGFNSFLAEETGI